METTALRKAIRYGSGCAAILALGVWLLSPERAVHGLVATYFTTPGSDVPVTERVERVAMVSSNDTLIDPTAAFRVEWRGFLWSDGAALTFRVPDKGLARLVIDGQEVFDTANVADHTRRTASVQLSAGSHSVAFAIEKEVADKSYFSAALQTQGPLGEQLLSAARLYPQEPDAATALHELQNAAVRRIAGIMILLAALAAGLTLWRPRADWWRSRDMWLLVTLVALACLLRWLYLRDLRVSLPNYQVLPPGSDHRGYIANGRDFVRGLWPPANNFYVQPGLTWISGQLQRVFSDGAQALRIMQALLSSMAVIGVYHISRLVFDRPAARLGASIWAIAPVPIFFDAQPLTHSLEALLVIVVLALWLHILDTGTTNGMHKRAGLLVAALGAMLGAAAVVRPSFLAFVPLVIATLLWQYRRTKIGIALACILVAAASLPVLPVTLHNYRTTGRFQLISSNGPVTLYIGNNRDSAGIGEYSPAYLATHELVNRGETSYVSQTWDDIQSQPLRWLGLLVRKTALYFAAGELPNNVDFYSQGIAASSVLARLPFRFGVLQPLALAGLALAISRRRSLGVYVLVGAVGLLALSAIAFHVVSRFRVPLYGPYAVLGGFTLASLIGEIRRRNARDIVTLLSIVGSVGLAQSALPWVAEHSM
ncbi:MAG: glycosyltransferase family 39 protein, partial [Anaerolineales bacterium]